MHNDRVAELRTPSTLPIGCLETFAAGAVKSNGTRQPALADLARALEIVAQGLVQGKPVTPVGRDAV